MYIKKLIEDDLHFEIIAATTELKECAYLRIYDRKALCESKNLIPLEEYQITGNAGEIVYTKKHAKNWLTSRTVA